MELVEVVEKYFLVLQQPSMGNASTFATEHKRTAPRARKAKKRKEEEVIMGMMAVVKGKKRTKKKKTVRENAFEGKKIIPRRKRRHTHELWSDGEADETSE